MPRQVVLGPLLRLFLGLAGRLLVAARSPAAGSGPEERRGLEVLGRDGRRIVARGHLGGDAGDGAGQHGRFEALLSQILQRGPQHGLGIGQEDSGLVPLQGSEERVLQALLELPDLPEEDDALLVEHGGVEARHRAGGLHFYRRGEWELDGS